MKVLIITTSVFEIQGILRFFNQEFKMCVSTYSFSRGKLEIDFLNTDAGNFNLIYRLTKQLMQESYDLVINAGISGTYIKDILPGAVFRVEKDRFVDFGAREKEAFFDIFDLGLMKENDFPFEKKWLHDKPGDFENLFNGIEKKIGLTVNSIPISEETLVEIRKECIPVIESMEGAGFFYVCRNEKVNCIQLRSVSNYAGERDKSKWEIKLAIENLGRQLKAIFDEVQ